MASVAPDAASLAAARKLAGSWSHAGSSGLALWGLCQGSGSKPYQAVVDLRGPAYKCSCPSRKFPCKHALGLLVEWSEGRVPSTDEPADFAAEWLSRREEKAENTGESGDEVPKKSPDPATAQKRADRVAGGLVELDLWIDRSRGGCCSGVRIVTAVARAVVRFGEREWWDRNRCQRQPHRWYIGRNQCGVHPGEFDDGHDACGPGKHGASSAHRQEFGV